MRTDEAVRDDLCARVSRFVAGTIEPDSLGHVTAHVTVDRLAETCAIVHHQLDARLATMVGMDDRERSGSFRLVYVFAVGDRWLSVEAPLDPAHPVFPAVTPRLPAAHWYEREVQDLLGLVPEGHPDPRHLVLHDDWPEGVYPLRKDFDASIPVPRVPGPSYRFHHLHGEGIVEIPVGPIHAGVIEPGHFRFAAVGEIVLHLEARLFYSHRGLERLAENKSFDHVLQIAERICGACAVAHAVAYCQAIESIAEVVIPPRAADLRTLFIELERLYNHVGDLGNICAGVGFAVGSSRGGWLKEELQRLNERLSGHRFLRGVCRVGGVRFDLSAAKLKDAIETLRRLEGEFRRFVGLMVSNEPFVERMKGTGVVPFKTARDLGAVGIAARASGLARDSRIDHPFGGYRGRKIVPQVRTEGDVLARALVRVDESYISFAMARELLSSLQDGLLAVPVGHLPSHSVGIGVAESPRGETVHWVRTGASGLIDRYRIRSASYSNWPVVTLAVPGNMVPDFPLINKSFELCYSCLDR